MEPNDPFQPIIDKLDRQLKFEIIMITCLVFAFAIFVGFHIKLAMSPNSNQTQTDVNNVSDANF